MHTNIYTYTVHMSMYIRVCACVCTSTVFSPARNILRHVEVHATLSVHTMCGGCRKALTVYGGGGAQGKKVPKLLVELNRC